MTAQSMILLTGATGLLGRYLAPLLSRRGRCLCLGWKQGTDGPGEARADLTDRKAVRALLDDCRPDLVVHAAALTDVDYCQEHPAEARLLNVEATRHLTDWVAETSPATGFVYISTDQVYDGPGPHTEDTSAPANIYAETKLEGEELVGRLAGALILRTNFFGLGHPGRAGFTDWLIESFQAGRSVTLFDDVLFNPIHFDHLGEILIELLDRGTTGTFNLGGRDGLSKAAFALALAERLGLDASAAPIGRLDDVDLGAPRPADMRMSLERIEAVLARPLPSVADGLDALRRQWIERQAKKMKTG